MRLGVISDTHGNLDRTERAVRLLRHWRVEQVIHCGDVGCAEIVGLLAPWPAHFVLGNVDNHVKISGRSALRACFAFTLNTQS